MVFIQQNLVLQDEELTFVASPSSGPGGQNVNKVSTRVTLLFDLVHSPSLTEYQRSRLQEKLANRINEEGFLRVICQVHRTQKANKDEVLMRFVRILQEALKEKPKRLKTKVPYRAVAERLETKKRVGEAKKNRSTAKRIPHDSE